MPCAALPSRCFCVKSFYGAPVSWENVSLSPVSGSSKLVEAEEEAVDLCLEAETQGGGLCILQLAVVRSTDGHEDLGLASEV